jgi:predicted small lipoprotein YifL
MKTFLPRRAVCLALAIAVIAAVVMTGCGRKGPPKPPENRFKAENAISLNC